MIKTVKVITWIIVGLTIYSFIGGVAYNVHERFYPGLTANEAGGVPFPGSEFMGLLWPVSVPIWGAIELGAKVAGLADSAVDDLIDE